MEQRVRDQLEQDGWKVTVEVFGDGFCIDLEHELSSPMSLGFTAGPRDPWAHLQWALKRREIVAIRERPEISHGQLLGTIRKASALRIWDEAGISLIARVLRANGLLTMAEAVWLSDAGIPWAQDEGD